jgi:hypothetical protein
MMRRAGIFTRGCAFKNLRAGKIRSLESRTSTICCSKCEEGRREGEKREKEGERDSLRERERVEKGGYVVTIEPFHHVQRELVRRRILPFNAQQLTRHVRAVAHHVVLQKLVELIKLEREIKISIKKARVE